MRIADTNLPNTGLGSLAGELSRSGWAIADTTSGTLVDWSVQEE